eukprot:TRINITY_DN25615_c0_g1_i1.p1 TRINITY_DN25615_c0_g1~~TRINITY_DN25615_c0_g1_i1.p1  ORF type:complete len:222 (-),score=25.90 TRINITY_DN25615_c0_g1_i1:156-782(-)
MALRYPAPSLHAAVSSSTFTRLEHLRIMCFHKASIREDVYGYRRAGARWVMQSGTGFSKRTESKPKHKVLTLDVSKAAGVDTFTLFARKIGEDGLGSAWEQIGDLLVESNADVEIALKERRKKLLAAAIHQHPLTLIARLGEDIQYGYKKVTEVEGGSESESESGTDVTPVDIKGKEPEKSVPAILRVDDGTNRPSLKASKAKYLNLR